MIDGHVHLENGPLTKEYVLDFVESAVNEGIDVLHILDHTHRFIEFAPIYQELKAVPQQKEWLDKKILEPLATYHQVIKEVKAMDLPITVKFGLEVCYVPKHKEYIKEILNQYPYDFVVGAIHSIDGLLYDMSFSNEILWDKFDIDHIYKRYYELVFDLVESDLFTQLAHVDTIKMFDCYPTYDLIPTYLELIKKVKKHHVLVENNTGCYYRYHHPDMGLSKELLSLLKHEEVLMITASDAHIPAHVGSFIKDIYEDTMK